MTKSYTFKGEINTSFKSWEQWIADGLTICNILGYEVNYYDFSIVGKLSGKVHPISGMQRKLKNIIKKEEKIKGMTMLVLPKDYKSASFDYIITLSRSETYLTLIMNLAYEMNIDEIKITDILRKNINVFCGEIYEMDIYECPEFYAAQANPKEFYKSLKVVGSLQ